MQVKQVAELLGVDKKDIIAEVEASRDHYTEQGYKLAKKLTAASSLDDEIVRHVMANFDIRRQKEDEKVKEEEDRRRREEEERQRAAEALRRKQEEEERAKRAEEARKAAEAELARKQAELAKQKAAEEERTRLEVEKTQQSEADQSATPKAPPAPTTHGVQDPKGEKKKQAEAEAKAEKAPPKPQEKPARSAQAPAPQMRKADAPAKPREKQSASGKEESPANIKSLQSFVDSGLQSDVKDEYRAKSRRARNKGKGEKGDKDWSEGKPRPKPKVDDGRKKIRPSQLLRLESGGERRPKPKKKSHHQGAQGQHQQAKAPAAPEPKVIKFRGDFTVGEFADKTGKSIADVMQKLITMGEMLTINNILDAEKAEELALEFEIEIEIEREGDDFDIERYLDAEDNEADLVARPPIVTVMGHVDHGKTSLLDKIRAADVAAGEAGGITQHIGAYHVETQQGDIVFLDTPGHEAFTEMRTRGANVTDLVILVVAANDGVMPQTVEAISHAKAADVPIIVALNKIDVDGANPDRVKQELMKYELIAEDFGGDTIVIPVSAITGQGISDLMEYVALQTEILELKANPKRDAVGTVVESHVDPNRGAVATILVEKGTLRIGDIFVCGTESGRVRAMRDDHDRPIEEAGPAVPVEILGITGSPVAGEKFVVIPSEPEAREIADRRRHRARSRQASPKLHVSLDNLTERMTEDDKVTLLNIIIKGDVMGSVEAIRTTLYRIESDRVAVKVIHSAVGAVSNSDINLADASDAIILAFNVGVDPSLRSLAEELRVDVRSYDVIYALKEDIENAMKGLLKPEFEEKQEGLVKVLQTFKVSKIGTIAGCFVEEGNVAIDHKARLIRDGAVIWKGQLRSLRRVKDDVKKVEAGLECGIGLQGYNDIKEGDLLETYSMVEQEASLVSSDFNKKPQAESV